MDLRSATPAERRAYIAQLTKFRYLAEIEPDAWQEPHAPTEAVEVVLRRTVVGHGRQARVETVTKLQCRRRVDEARLFEAMSQSQERAFYALRVAHRLYSLAGWHHGSSLQYVSEPSELDVIRELDAGEREKRLRVLSADFRRWLADCIPARINSAVCIDIAGDGKSLRQVQEERRRGRPWVLRNLGEGLDLFAQIRHPVETVQHRQQSESVAWP